MSPAVCLSLRYAMLRCAALLDPAIRYYVSYSLLLLPLQFRCTCPALPAAGVPLLSDPLSLPLYTVVICITKPNQPTSTNNNKLCPFLFAMASIDYGGCRIR